MYYVHVWNSGIAICLIVSPLMNRINGINNIIKNIAK